MLLLLGKTKEYMQGKTKEYMQLSLKSCTMLLFSWLMTQTFNVYLLSISLRREGSVNICNVGPVTRSNLISNRSMPFLPTVFLSPVRYCQIW